MQLSSFIRDTVLLVQKDEEDQASDLATCFAFIFRSDFSNTLLPAQFYSSLNADLGIPTPSFKFTTQVSSSSAGAASSLIGSDLDLISGCLLNSSYRTLVAESIAQKPVFVLFKELAATGNQSHEREVLIQVMSEFYVKQNRIGYYFLYYMYSVMQNLQLSTSANTSVNASKSSKG